MTAAATSPEDSGTRPGGYTNGYHDGYATGRMEWPMALWDVLPDHIKRDDPKAVADYIELLMHRVGVRVRPKKRRWRK